MNLYNDFTNLKFPFNVIDIVKMMKCTGLVFLVWNFLIYNVNAYPDFYYVDAGITWSEANTKCGNKGLEYHKEKIQKSNIPIEHEFWIGKAVYRELTPWIEVLGCTTSIGNDIKVYSVKSFGHCQIKCDSKKAFGYKDKEQNSNCVCFTRVVPFVKISACNIMNGFLVYKFYSGKIPDDSVDPGNCVTLCCGNCNKLQQNTLVGRNCDAAIGSIAGRCEPYVQNLLWGYNYNNSRVHCWQSNRLLLPSTFCSITSSLAKGLRAWTNVFRENIDVVKTGLFKNPVMCYTGVLHETENGTKELSIFRGECNNDVKCFICKNGNAFDTKLISVSPQPFTKEQITVSFSKTDSSTNSYTGVIIGGTFGAFVLLILSAAIFVCRKKSIGIFKGKKKTIDNKEEVSQTPNYDLHCVSASHVEPISNQNYGIATNESSTYAVVNKLKKSDKKFTNNDETYTDSPDGQYDQLNNIQKRKIILEGNLYDSHEGMRDQNDPTYDISEFSRSHEVTNVYDHSILGTQNDREYV